MEQPAASDEGLMAQVASGQREHLETLVRRYASPLLTYLCRMVGSRDRAEDLFQDVFLAVWEKRRTYRFPQTFRAWLFTIAANRCRQTFRRARSRSAVSLQDLAGEPAALAAGTPAESAMVAETAKLVSAAVARLPDQQRTVLVLRTWNGLSYAEIAQIMGREEATVRSHMHHALAAVRRFLEPRMKADEL